MKEFMYLFRESDKVRFEQFPATIADHFFRHEASRVIVLLVKYFETKPSRNICNSE